MWRPGIDSRAADRGRGPCAGIPGCAVAALDSEEAAGFAAAYSYHRSPTIFPVYIELFVTYDTLATVPRQGLNPLFTPVLLIGPNLGSRVAELPSKRRSPLQLMHPR